MNSLLFLRKSALPSSRRVTVAALTTSIEALLHHHRTPSSGFFPPKDAPCTAQVHSFTTAASDNPSIKPRSKLLECFNVNFGVVNRGLHMGAASSLNSRSSMIADVSDVEKTASFDSSRGPASDDDLLITNLGISQDIVSALARRGITKLFPIQQAVLQPAMQGRDMIGRARTGTGKTLAFGIPIMDKIIQFNAKHGQGRNPLALILAPTRELARQVDKEFYESGPNLDTLCVYGGVPIQRQMSSLDRGVDVVVGTPGRVIDLIKRGALNLSEVRFVVLDEADQMLNVGFAEDVEVILENLPKKRQSMMFSATMPSWIMKITHKYLNNPLTIDLVGDSDQKLPDGISLYSIVSEMHERPSVLGPLITEHAKGGKCIVFTQTKRDADRMAYAMQKTFRCEPLHGDISQSQRERTLSGFRDGKFNVLVATDVAARGLDVPNVDLIVHYELPNTSEIFVHRSGRTGRAGKKGSAILIYSSHQHRDVKGIERDVGCRFTELPRIAVEGSSGNIFGDMGDYGSRFGSFRNSRGGRFGDTGSGRSGGGRFADSRSGRSSDSRSGDSGFGRSGGSRFGDSGFGRSGGSRFGDSGFGRSGGSRFGYSGFGHPGGSENGRFGSYGDNSSQSGGSFDGPSSGGFGGLGNLDPSSGSGDFGSRGPSRFGCLDSRTTKEFNRSQSNQFGGFGVDKIGD